MPYSIGEKGSYGCSGYPVIKTKTGEVMGCHPSQDDAMKQLAALHMNEPEATKSDSSVAPANPSQNPLTTYPGVGIKYPDVNPRGNKRSRKRNRKIGPDSGSNATGAISSGGSGGSMGVGKYDDIWSGSPFSK